MLSNHDFLLDQSVRDLRAAQRRGQRARALLERANAASGTPVADCVRQLLELGGDIEAVILRLEALAAPAPQQSAGELIAAGGLGRYPAKLGRMFGFGGVR